MSRSRRHQDQHASEKSLRATIYTRVSTEGQVEDGTSLRSQFAACQTKAEVLGAEVVALHEDRGVSGGLFITRPGIQAALRDIEEGRANVLIAYDISRLSRDEEHQAIIKKVVARANAQLMFCTMEVADTPEGSLAFSIMGGFASYEKKVIRERTVRGKRRNAQEGKQVCRAVSPFGYHIVTKKDVLMGLYAAGTEGTYVIVEERAQWVRKMFSRYQKGASLRSIARWLQESKVPTPGGAAYWKPEAVHSILRNSVHKGVATFSRTITRMDEALLQQGYTRPYVVRERDESEWIKIPCPALVEVTLWEDVQRRLDESRARYSGNPARRRLLTGLMRCPICGRRMVAQRWIYKTQTGTPNGHYYHCNSARPSSNSAGVVCHPIHYNGGRADSMILDAISQLAHTPELVTAAVEVYRKQDVNETKSFEGEMRVLRDRMAKLKAQESVIITGQLRAIEQGISSTIYENKLRECMQERTNLEAELNRLVLAQEGSSLTKDLGSLSEQYLADLQEALNAPELSPAEKGVLLSHLIMDITPRDGEGAKGPTRGEGGKFKANVAIGEKYRVRLKPFSQQNSVETVGGIVTCPSSRGWRITSSTSR